MTPLHAAIVDEEPMTRVSDALVRRVNQLYHELTQDSFDHDHRRRHRAEHELWQSVAGMLRRPSGAAARTVADIGCGTGFVAVVLGDALRPGDHVVAMDVTEGALRSTAAKWQAAGLHARGPSLRCVLSDVQTLPLADRSVDVVTINAALHHLPAPETALAEIDRVLRPGGLFALGFEPNHGHFQSSVMRRLAQGLDRACWYASPRQNRRRIREWLAPSRMAPPNRWVGPINARLLGDGLIAAPLSPRRILELVDPHACGAKNAAGFDPRGLIAGCFSGYEVLLLKFSDYLGESVRQWPLARAAADRLFGALATGRGALFSWIIRKPGLSESRDAIDVCAWEAT